MCWLAARSLCRVEWPIQALKMRSWIHGWLLFILHNQSKWWTASTQDCVVRRLIYLEFRCLNFCFPVASQYLSHTKWKTSVSKKLAINNLVRLSAKHGCWKRLWQIEIYVRNIFQDHHDTVNLVILCGRAIGIIMSFIKVCYLQEFIEH